MNLSLDLLSQFPQLLWTTRAGLELQANWNLGVVPRTLRHSETVDTSPTLVDSLTLRTGLTGIYDTPGSLREPCPSPKNEEGIPNYFEITPQAIRSPAFPDGSLFRSSAFA